MTSKFVIKRNKFIASLVRKYTEDLDSILDLGCGEGLLLRYLRRPVYYHGVDLNYLGNSNLIENSDITEWKSDKMYDIIVLQEVIEHLRTYERLGVLHKCWEWMYDNSKFIVSVPNINRFTNRFCKIPKLLDETHQKEYEDMELDFVLEGMDFHIIEKHYWLLYLPFEKQIGWFVPDFIRNWILKMNPTLASHFVYVVQRRKYD